MKINGFLKGIINLTLFISVYTFFGQESIPITYYSEETISIFESLQKEDELTKALKDKYQLALDNKNIPEQVKTLNDLGSIYCNRIDYEKSYDYFWRALLLSEKENYNLQLPHTYRGLSVLYDLYERKEASLDYNIKALNANKSLIKEGAVEKNSIYEQYNWIANYYFYAEKPELMEKYIDSTAQFVAKPNSNFMKAKRGFLKIIQKRFAEAEKELLAIKPYYEKKQPSYLVVFYGALGDLYQKWNKPTKAIAFYKKSNEQALKGKRNLNFLPRNYERISFCYNLLKDDINALRFKEKALEINQYLYSSRSPKNRFLLDIKDQLMVEKERTNKLAAEQELEQLQHQESLWKLRSTIISISIVFLILLGIGIYRSLVNKHKNEKQLLLQKKSLEQQQSKEILEIKNKELTESTLRLMAKDELLANLKRSLTDISKDPTPREVKKLVKEIQINSKDNWDEFESRFTMVNEGFYERMKVKFPNLSPYDLKISALVKLGFSGKEMAKVMGISPESANTARYRLRKRLGLHKDENLVRFVREV